MKRWGPTLACCLAVGLGSAGIACAQTITSISPTQTTAGALTFTLTVNGVGFYAGDPNTPKSVVEWNGTALTTTFVKTTQLRATVPGGLVSSSGVAAISVRNPILSNAVPFTINPPPAITTPSILPEGTLNMAYSLNLAVSDGTSPFSWSVLEGFPPPGLTLSSTGRLSGTPTRAGEFAFIVAVKDAASITATKSFNLTINTGPVITTYNPLPNGKLGSKYSQTLEATGGTLPYSWSIAGGSLPAGLSLSSTGVLSGTPTVTGTFGFTVRVRDSVDRSTLKDFTLTIDAPPFEITTPSPLPAGTVGVSYSQTLTAAGGEPPYIWSISSGNLPGGISLSRDGVLSGTPPAAGTFNFIVRVLDSRLVSTTKAFSLGINLTAVQITTATPLPKGTAGLQYSYTLAASGGTPPYNWSIASGSLPTGLSLGGSGDLSGTPAKAGTYSFTVRATDNVNASGTKMFTLTVDPAALQITTATPLPNGAVGLRYSYTLVASGGTPPYNWSIDSGSLPAGLGLSGSGVLSGSPTTVGTYSFTLRVTDSVKASATKAFALAVNLAPLQITTATPLPNGVVDAPYSLELSAVGGSPSYAWSLASGTPPPGLGLSNAGLISGTPTTVGTYNFTVRVTDSKNASATKALSLTVTRAPIQITTQSPLPKGTLNAGYSQTLVASGGDPPYDWTVTSGNLPPGLVLAVDGVLKGTATAGGTFHFTVQVRDRAQATATRSFELVIEMPPLSAVTVSGLTDSLNPGEQPAFGVSLGSGYPLWITGTITLSVTPDSDPPVDDPAIQFASGGRTLEFTIPAGQTQATFSTGQVALQTGTVAGMITLTVSLRVGEQDITPTPAPVRSVRVNSAPPAITSLTVRRTGSGFEAEITGFSTPRQITQATFRFTGAPGSNLQTSELTVSLESAFGNWYRGESSAQYGSTFKYTQPFTVQGDLNAVSSVTVTLSNGQGVSQPVSRTF